LRDIWMIFPSLSLMDAYENGLAHEQ
jgi:hypothetical protein